CVALWRCPGCDNEIGERMRRNRPCHHQRYGKQPRQATTHAHGSTPILRERFWVSTVDLGEPRLGPTTIPGPADISRRNVCPCPDLSPGRSATLLSSVTAGRERRRWSRRCCFSRAR